MMDSTSGSVDAFFSEHVVKLHQEVGDEMLDAK
jgi:hypothetical protein